MCSAWNNNGPFANTKDPTHHHPRFFFFQNQKGFGYNHRKTDLITNGVTVDSAVSVEVNSSVVVSDVEGTLLVLDVEASSTVVVGVFGDSVLTVVVSIGRIISTRNLSVLLSTPNSVKVIGTFGGIPSILICSGA